MAETLHNLVLEFCAEKWSIINMYGKKSVLSLMTRLLLSLPFMRLIAILVIFFELLFTAPCRNVSLINGMSRIKINNARVLPVG